MEALLSQTTQAATQDTDQPPIWTRCLPPFPSRARHMNAAKRGEHTKIQPLPEPLSERELQVLQLLARGASNQEIAQELVITVDTVKRHVSHIFSKLGAQNRVQAVRQARELGLLDESSL